MKMSWMRVPALALLLGAAGVGAQEPEAVIPTEPVAAVLPAPPGPVTATDHAWDHGDRIDLSWELSPDDPGSVSQYRIGRSEGPEGPFLTVGRAPAGTGKFAVEPVDRDRGYYFEIVAVGAEGAESPPSRTALAVAAHRDPFDGGRFWVGMITLIFCGSVIYWIRRARTGVPLKVRKIAGLEAVDEAVGRATEMGRSCLFIPGIQDMNDIQTIAGITVLARVAKTAAEFDARIEVPCTRSLVMTAARETVQASFMSAGRPDAFNSDLIYYVTDEQFGYVAYLQGMMVREKPAACFYMGAFFAESLILAETGNTVGAIQVAGTAMPAQLPFFVAACDYTLIGEEFFAASAYLSGEPDQLGSLKGQDVGKAIVSVLILAGVILATVASILGPGSAFGATLSEAVRYLRDVILV